MHIPWRISSFDDFHVFFKEFHIEIDCLFPWLCLSQNLYTHIIWCFLMILFSWVWYVLYNFWVFGDHVIFMFHEKYFYFIPYLKDFVLVFKFFIKLVRILHMVEFSYMLNLFSNIFLKTPTHLRAVGWATIPCMLFIENLFKTCAWYGSGKWCKKWTPINHLGFDKIDYKS